MTHPFRMILILGTRPDAIKMAPIIRACREQPGVCVSVISTGQHSRLMQPILRWFECELDRDLHLMIAEQGLGQLTGRALSELSAVLMSQRPDAVLAVGDTASTVAAGLAAFYNRVPFVHVEAGLRTHLLDAPWPEELNRRIAALTAAVHCAPTRRAVDNLRNEQVAEHCIHLTGNPVVDALEWTREKLHRESPDRQDSVLPPPLRDQVNRPIVLVTCHRRENLGEPIRRVMCAVERIALSRPDCLFILPVHANPEVRKSIPHTLEALPNVLSVEPLDYPDHVLLMERASLILSDSGGIQEEVPSLGTPLLVLRDVTERPEAVELGYARLVGTTTELIVEEAVRVLDGHHWPVDVSQGNPFGDGNAANRIVACVRHSVTLTE